uniref:ubiquitinyl hydrolase 1 n=1 Tax=viral metagenome TaxID=1070528 RepID=A0A6C0I109_9ZZZZ
MKLLQIILLIILLILSALLIAINLKLYKINNIKRGGEVTDNILEITYGSNYTNLSDEEKTAFILYLSDLSITNDEIFNNFENNAKLLDSWRAGQQLSRNYSDEGWPRNYSDEDNELQSTLAASLKEDLEQWPLQNATTANLKGDFTKLYNLWRNSPSANQHCLRIEIKFTFPNFFSNIITDSIDISNLEVGEITDSHIYFDIKYNIWKHCTINNFVDSTETSYTESFYHNAILDACDINGWVIQSFNPNNVGNGIYTFINAQIANIDKIIFVPRGDLSMASFIKNIVFGRQRTIDKPLTDGGYYGTRKIIGDGNCYYTAFIFNLLEYALFASTSIRNAIKINIISALTEIKWTIRATIEIYDRENNKINKINKTVMRENYENMLKTLTTFFDSAHSIFELERLFNQQDIYGRSEGIYIPLVYGCKLLIAYYMFTRNTPESIKDILLTTVNEKKRSKIEVYTKESVLSPFIRNKILTINYDMADIVQLPILAYSFKCGQRIISTSSNIETPYVYYNNYVDPYNNPYIYTSHTFDTQLNGMVNLLLIPEHYDIVYCHPNNIPDPIFSLDGQLIPDTVPLLKEEIKSKRDAIANSMQKGIKGIPYPITIEQEVANGKKIADIAKKVAALPDDEIIEKVLYKLSFIDLYKLIKCKQIKMQKYQYLDNIDKKILEIANRIKLCIEKLIDYYSMRHLITTNNDLNNDLNNFQYILAELKIEIELDEDDQIVFLENSPSKQEVYIFFLKTFPPILVIGGGFPYPNGFFVVGDHDTANFGKGLDWYISDFWEKLYEELNGKKFKAIMIDNGTESWLYDGTNTIDYKKMGEIFKNVIEPNGIVIVRGPSIPFNYEEYDQKIIDELYKQQFKNIGLICLLVLQNYKDLFTIFSLNEGLDIPILSEGLNTPEIYPTIDYSRHSEASMKLEFPDELSPGWFIKYPINFKCMQYGTLQSRGLATYIEDIVIKNIHPSIAIESTISDIDEIIPEIDTTIINILVYCYPEQIDTYYNYSALEDIIKIYRGNSTTEYKIYTLDNKIGSNSDFKVNGFKNEFIDSQIEKWDIIFIADCDGKLIHNIHWFKNVLDKIIKMVKISGEIYFSNIDISNIEDLISKLSNYYSLNRYNNMIQIIKYI